MLSYSPDLNKPSKGWFDHLLRNLINLNNYTGSLMYADSTGYSKHKDNAQDPRLLLLILINSYSGQRINLKIGKLPNINRNATLSLNFLNTTAEDCDVFKVFSNGSLNLLTDPEIKELSFTLDSPLDFQDVIKNPTTARSSVSLIYKMNSKELRQGLITVLIIF